MAKLPTIKDVAFLIREIKKDVPLKSASDAKDYMDTDAGETAPGIDITIGWSNETGEWSYQTGDNSFRGGAYGYPIWATGRVYRATNSREAARDLIDQLYEQTW